MKALKVLLVILLFWVFLSLLAGGRDALTLGELLSLEWLEGAPVAYQFGAVATFVITLWGLLRLMRQ